MTKNRNERQFDEYREWQWAKHMALGDYIVPWSMKVGSTANRIFVADLFAGAATYTDEFTGQKTDGSPVIFARRAAKYGEDRPGKSMHVICTERNRKNFASLSARMSGWVESGHATLRHGNFARHCDDVLTQMGTDPALILLDPIGLKTITADVCRPLLHRIGKTDVFIILHFKVIHRTAGMLLATGHANPEIPAAKKAAETLDALFDSPRWRFIACQPGLDAMARERMYVDLYFEQVLGERFGWKCAFPVRPKYESKVKYWLVQASDDIGAFMLMNDEIVKLDALLFQRTVAAIGTIEGFEQVESDARYETTLGKLQKATIALLDSTDGQALPFEQIRRTLLDDYFGQVKQGAYWKVIKAACKAGTLTREHRLAATVTDTEIIRLTSPTTPAPGRRTEEVVVPIRPAA
jgi:three-Cys-motif partner protein